ncbi:MAG: TSUP family transporter, partial [Actinomycetota bacterium]
GNIDWVLVLVVTIGAIPGARLGARLALDARERTLRLAVGAFLLVVAAAYGTSEAVELLGS